jgi:hypothetical protein
MIRRDIVYAILAGLIMFIIWAIVMFTMPNDMPTSDVFALWMLGLGMSLFVVVGRWPYKL